MPETQEQWYTNKDLFEMVQGLQKDLQETRTLIQQYNGLRSRLDICDAALADLISQSKGRATVGNAVRAWGGWIIAIISLVTTLYKTF